MCREFKFLLMKWKLDIYLTGLDVHVTGVYDLNQTISNTISDVLL